MDYANQTAAIMANVMVPSEPSRQFIRVHRVTKGGRHLWYEIEVIQQPERARACGSGPKSSADRRPVDPPPVLQFKVREGEVYETARDITFDYNADFFVFASLEHARPMAHGRVQTPAATSPPVLTGFPVSGCCYLDRPVPAGYFIFPDLSVRHEGRYRLIFTLYEQIKEDQDEEVEPRPDEQENFPGDENGQGFYHRMEIKSDEFVVFSAKKFPGLAESTLLSRTVAEQGCRVRIRRDVRMRKRETKPSLPGDYDNADDEYSRRRQTRTPDVRPRSASNSSMDRSYVTEHQRRPSGADYGHPAPPMFPASQPENHHLNFGQPKTGIAPPSYIPPAPLASSTPVSPAHPSPYHASQHGPYQHPLSSPSYPPPQSYYESTSAKHDSDMNKPGAGYPTIAAKPPVLAPYPRISGVPGTPDLKARSSVASLPPITNFDSIKVGHRPTEPFAKPAQLYPTREPQPTKRSRDEVFHDPVERIQNRQRQTAEHIVEDDGYRRADGRVIRPDFPTMV